MVQRGANILGSKCQKVSPPRRGDTGTTLHDPSDSSARLRFEEAPEPRLRQQTHSGDADCGGLVCTRESGKITRRESTIEVHEERLSLAMQAGMTQKPSSRFTLVLLVDIKEGIERPVPRVQG